MIFLKKYKPLFLILICIVLMYAIHRSLTFLLEWNSVYAGFRFSLEKLYLCFGLASLLIIFVLLKVKQRNFDQIGMAFMALITIKMFVFYFVFKSVISSEISETEWERTNFIILFMAFLILETVVSAQILKSQEKK